MAGDAGPGAEAPPFESGPALHAIATCDARGIILSFNESAERLFGRRSAAVVGRPLTVLMPKRFYKAYNAGFARFVKAGESKVIGRTVELVGLRADGAEFPVEISLVTTSVGEHIRVTAVISDIQERVQGLEARRRMTELQDLSIRVMGHDLKAPIAAIQGYLDIALQELAKAPEGKSLDAAKRAVAKAVEASARMLVVLSNARAVSLLTTAPVAAPKDAVVDVARLVRQAADGLRPLAEAKKHVLKVSVPEELKVALPPAFDSVVANLVANAIKFTPEGGLIAVTLSKGDTSVKLEVEDTGPGVPPEVRPQLFRKFERLAPGRIEEGHGLGLSIVASVVELADGRVSVHERPDGRRGSLFRVEIPLRQP